MKTQYIHFTPIPQQVPRQLAIEILQSHGEIITLNPLVLDHHPIKAPRDCPNDEYYSTWYEITQRIQFVPGFKRLGSSRVTFRGCFHDMPWGVQTHMYIPMGVDLRNKWMIKGNQLGEAPEPRELGSGAPSSGLYLREEVEIRCNPLALSFVKKEMKAASLVMVERMIKKAELLDAGVLQAMFENGKLKTFNPHDRTLGQPANSPQPHSPGPNRWRPDSMQSAQSSQDPNSRMSTYSQVSQMSPHPTREAPNQLGQISHPEGKGLAVEMPGDFLYPNEQANQNIVPSDRMSSGNRNVAPSDRMSQASGSDHSPNQRDSRWSYVSSDYQSNAGGDKASSVTGNPNKAFKAELPGSGHTDFEVNTTPRSPNGVTQTQGFEHKVYNPQDYARFSGNPHT